MEKLYLAGESISPGTRTEIEEGFGADVVDRYGAMETGQMALQCPEGIHYHVQSENVVVEVVNADGQPVEPGEQGRVVVTTLHNYAFPLIRYQIDDVVTLGDSCSCGTWSPGRQQHPRPKPANVPLP